MWVRLIQIYACKELKERKCDKEKIVFLIKKKDDELKPFDLDKTFCLCFVIYIFVC